VQMTLLVGGRDYVLFKQIFRGIDH
jgi:hypothetical protein